MKLVVESDDNTPPPAVVEVSADVSHARGARVVITFHSDERGGWVQQLSVGEAKRLILSLTDAVDAIESEIGPVIGG